MESFRLENIFNIIKSNCYEAEFLPTEQRRLLLCSPHQSPPGAWAPSPLLHIQSRGRAVGSLPLVFLSYSRANEDIFLCDMIEIYQIFFWNIFTLFTQPKKKINLTVLLICSTNNYGKKYTNKTWKGVEVSSQKFSDVFPFLLELEVLMRGRNFLVLTDKRTTSEENKSIQAKPLRFFIEDFSTLVLGVHCFYIDEKSA